MSQERQSVNIYLVDIDGQVCQIPGEYWVEAHMYPDQVLAIWLPIEAKSFPASPQEQVPPQTKPSLIERRLAKWEKTKPERFGALDLFKIDDGLSIPIGTYKYEGQDGDSPKVQHFKFKVTVEHYHALLPEEEEEF